MVRTFARAAGIIYLLVGLLGFIPTFLSPYAGPDLAVDSMQGRLLGLFPVNLMHNLVHIAIGLWGLSAARSLGASVGFARGLAVLYTLLAIMGLIPGLKTMFGLAPLHGNDVWLHAATALVAAYFGWGATRDTAVTRT
ncbi:DUF4383 domain-containing protein [Deinococcus deserti]|uniref:DUF4383 domain-containing protein n=1 Tax=Deinococcus deserti (strain DSM 17065 / CIP 109153 / LMG 22923 / VCD115) TaxID=546414 RepID=C1CUZ6_DEIDV|nr:DUF4383 domain-containing protein [Deinococcus deserti]ACO46013.1 conserved hypothetical protein; putative membrane protein [Deinococcus deserti VCD115]